jgi:hypothetical protein
VVAVAIFLAEDSMASKHREQPENTCSYCLYFKPPPNSRQNARGNCSLHKEWIESAARTTCSEMSNRRLAKGIYQLLEQSRGESIYIQRTTRIRTRLFLVPAAGRGGAASSRARPQERNSPVTEKLT